MTLAEANGNVVPVTRARVLRIEQRLADIAKSSEQRDAVLRDATADFVVEELAPRDAEIVLLKTHNAQLEARIAALEAQLQQKTAVDQQVAEIAKRLDAKQIARDEAKRGPKGRQGERGARGEKGPAGPRGPAGGPAPVVHNWHIDTAKYRAIPFYSDGTPGPELNLLPLFEAFFRQTSSS